MPAYSLFQNGVTTFPTGSVTVPATTAGAVGTVTITDAAISSTSLIFLTHKEGSVAPAVNATVATRITSQTAGSAVVSCTATGAGNVLVTNYTLNYLVLG